MDFSLAHLEMLYCWMLAPASPPSSMSQLLRLLTRNHSSTLQALTCVFSLPQLALVPRFLSLDSPGPVLFLGQCFHNSPDSTLTSAATNHSSHSSEILSCHYWAPVPIGDYTVYRIRPQPPPHNPPGSWVHSLCSVLPNTLIFFHLSYSKV